MSKWTPGPWWIAGKGTIRWGDPRKGASGWIGSAHWRNQTANATLIAAAPDLAEALTEIASTLDVESYPENGSLESRLGMIARAALAKARGEA